MGCKLTRGLVATEKYYGVNAFKFISKEGEVTTLRYRIVPVAAPAYLGVDALAAKKPTYLFDELGKRLQSQAVEFKLVTQIAGEGDVTDNATVVWPEGREVVELGSLRVEKMLGERRAV